MARFIKSSTLPSHFPPPVKPEIAIVGRSNVGKSSLINHLTDTKGLAKVSASPGKTQLINFFDFGKVVLVDLPGYGFAKVSRSIREEWGPMIEGYLEHRENLKAIIFLLDSRREPTKDDIALIDWLESKNKNIIFVLTKTDKLNQSELHQQSKMIKETLQIEDFIPYSTTRYKGREILQHMINKAIA